jgi:serine/threonine protein kinase
MRRDETDDLNTEDQVGMPTGLAHVNCAGGGSHEEGSKHERIGLSDFEELEVLGRGGFGCVKLVRRRGGVDDGTLYATKVAEKNCLYWGTDVAELMTERRVLEMNGESEFLVRLHYAFQTRETVHPITDFFRGGDMAHLIYKGRLPESDVRFYMSEIVLAIEKLHKMGVVHWDIKSENILIDCAGHVPVADYGICNIFSPE